MEFAMVIHRRKLDKIMCAKLLEYKLVKFKNVEYS